MIVIALTWGSSFILIKKSLIAFSPLEIGAMRVAVSGLLLTYIGIPALRKMSRVHLKWVVITGFFGNFLPMFLFPLAQTQVSSSLAGILDSLVPVFVLVLGFILFGIKCKFIQVLSSSQKKEYQTPINDLRITKKFTMWYVLGRILILIGIYLIRERKKNPRPVVR